MFKALVIYVIWSQLQSREKYRLSVKLWWSNDKSYVYFLFNLTYLFHLSGLQGFQGVKGQKGELGFPGTIHL